MAEHDSPGSEKKPHLPQHRRGRDLTSAGLSKSNQTRKGPHRAQSKGPNKTVLGAEAGEWFPRGWGLQEKGKKGVGNVLLLNPELVSGMYFPLKIHQIVPL